MSGHYDVDQEVRLVVEHMKRLCTKQPDGTMGVKFAVFFGDSQVEQTFESLVGSLKAAKKRGVINFPGQMLLMPTHKDVMLTLLAP
ncbi:costars family protein ABRACL [Pelomyxa schiedti]|nr:costars family protein ABRACL [Pelomyxa schiedti]